MEILHTLQEMRDWRGATGTLLPFVPTMGALHEGHASLVRRAREMADGALSAALGGGAMGRVAASIFVNPTQFGPSEDFARYPRTLDEDSVILGEAGCDAVFVPSVEEMYGTLARLSTEGSGQMTSIDPGPLGALLEGEVRPGHFRGVCTVVAKLLNIVMPTHLLLGQKDFQQLAVLRRMCADLSMCVEVVSCATLREAGGLAMSSRNRYLTAAERPRASALFAALSGAVALYRGGERRVAVLEESMRRTLESAGLEVQYAVVRAAADLTPLADGLIPPAEGLISPAEGPSAPAVALIAAKLGNTRLIDNMLLNL